MDARGLPRPILVGGGAVEFYSGSTVMTGDIDVTSPVQPELEEELQSLGFVRPSGRGQALCGWIHPDLGLGFEVVGNSPMGGGIDPARLRLVSPAGETAFFRIISVEDLVADRMGQFASGSAHEMRDQARILVSLYPDLDRSYLDRRIREGRSVTTAPKKLKAETTAPEPVIDMAEFGRDLLRRRAAAGDPDAPRNSGLRRTASKRALLKAIEKAGGSGDPSTWRPRGRSTLDRR